MKRAPLAYFGDRLATPEAVDPERPPYPGKIVAIALPILAAIGQGLQLATDIATVAAAA